jgi:hypothetical protein
VSEEPERWTPVWDGPDLEVSWDGNFRVGDRVSPSGRHLKGGPVATTTTKDGYVLVKYVNAQGKRVTRQAHRVVLENFEFRGKPIPDGLQSRHYDDRGTNNKWRPGATEEESRARGGNLFTGDGPKQHQDKVRNNGGRPLPVPPPQHDCINYEHCGGKTRNPGKRCVPCVEQVGRDAGDMLRAGENLQKVAERFGYKGTDWVFSLAQKHGGYTGTKEQAWAQRRGRLQRVTAGIRARMRRDAPSPDQAGRAATAPFGRPSQHHKLGQTRTPETPDVAERNPPKVTERDRPHYRYPADLVNRERAPRKGRSR